MKLNKMNRAAQLSGVTCNYWAYTGLSLKIIFLSLPFSGILCHILFQIKFPHIMQQWFIKILYELSKYLFIGINCNFLKTSFEANIIELYEYWIKMLHTYVRLRTYCFNLAAEIVCSCVLSIFTPIAFSSKFYIECKRTLTYCDTHVSSVVS